MGRNNLLHSTKNSIYKKFIQIKNVPHRIKRNFDDDLLHHGVNMRAATGKQVFQYKNTFFHVRIQKKNVESKIFLIVKNVPFMMMFITAVNL